MACLSAVDVPPGSYSEVLADAKRGEISTDGGSGRSRILGEEDKLCTA